MTLAHFSSLVRICFLSVVLYGSGACIQAEAAPDQVKDSNQKQEDAQPVIKQGEEQPLQDIAPKKEEEKKDVGVDQPLQDPAKTVLDSFADILQPQENQKQEADSRFSIIPPKFSTPISTIRMETAFPILKSGEPPKGPLNFMDDRSDASTYRQGAAPSLKKKHTKDEDELILSPEDFFKDGDSWMPGVKGEDPWGRTTLYKREGKLHKISPSGYVENLDDALAHAYNKNPDLQEARINFNRSVETLSQANATNRPLITLEGSERFHHNSNSLRSRSTIPVRGPTSLSHENENNNSSHLAVQLNQNIFSGGSNTAAIEKGEQNVRSQLAALDAKEQAVFREVVTAYVKVVVGQVVLAKERMLELYNNELSKQERLREVFGEKKLSDVAMVDSKLSGATMRVRSAEADLVSARAALASLCGANLAPSLSMPEPYSILPDTVEDLEKNALAYNPEILQEKFQEFAARHALEEVSAKFLPNVDLTASAGPNYNKEYSKTTSWQEGDEDDPTLGNRDSRRFRVEANVGVVFSMPIYSRGVNSSLLRDAQQMLKAARLKVEEARRRVYSQCRSFFAALQASKENVTSCRIWLENSRVALQSVELENALGEQDFLGVLQVQDEWSKAYQSYIETMGELIKNSYYVLSMEGKLNARHLGLNVTFYNPMDYYEDHRNAWFSFVQDQEDNPLFVPVQDEREPLPHPTLHDVRVLRKKGKEHQRKANQAGIGHPSQNNPQKVQEVKKPEKATGDAAQKVPVVAVA